MRTYLDFEDPKDIFAQRRSELSFTQHDVAKGLGYKNFNFISILESGRSEIPIEKVPEICRVLKMDTKWYLEKVMRKRWPGVAAVIFNQESPIDRAPAREIRIANVEIKVEVQA